MPANQPEPEISALENPLLQAYRRAWERIQEQQQAIALDPLKWRKRARLVEVQKSVEAMMNTLDVQAEEWVTSKLPQIFRMGLAAGAAEAPGTGAVVWSMIQQEAVESIAIDLFQDLLKSTKTVRRSTKELIRTVAKDEILQKLIEGDTAVAAGKRMEKILATKGIHAVKYANGAKHGLAEYSQMAVRTKTAVAYNVGTLNGAEAQGVKFWEVFDGPFCGWSYHDDSVANGRIVSKDEALSYPISHPNCRRAFGARPDITSKKGAAKDKGSTTDGQRQAQIAQDQERLAFQKRQEARRRRGGGKGKGSTSPGGNGPQKPSGGTRKAKQNQRLSRTGELDLNPPSQLTDDLILHPLDDPYAGVISVHDLISQGFSPEDAAKEHKRLKANAASKASKAKAKAAKSSGVTPEAKASPHVDVEAPKAPVKAKTLLDEDQDAYKAWKAEADKAFGAGLLAPPRPNPKLLQSSNPVLGLGYIGPVMSDKWWAPLKVDTPNYIPVQGITVQKYKIQTGLATRRDGISYMMETKPGEAITQALKDEFEKSISIAQEALKAVPAHARVEQKGIAFLRGNNPADAHWAKKYNKPDFKSAATGGKGGTIFWNSKVTHGNVIHEFGHSFDYERASAKGLGTQSASTKWADAKKADQTHSGTHTGGYEDFSGSHPLTFGTDGVTTYGSAAIEEDYAEAVRLYFRDRVMGKTATSIDGTPLRFSDIFPERAKLLDEAFGLDSFPDSTVWAKAERAKAIAKAEKAALQAKAIDIKPAVVDGPKLNAHGYPEDYVNDGVPQHIVDAFNDANLNDNFDVFAKAVTDTYVLKNGADPYNEIIELENYLSTHNVKIWHKDAAKIPVPKGSLEVPEFKQAKKELPDNVKASIASKKSKMKKELISQGKSPADAAKLADVMEQEEVYKRWRSLFGGNSQVKTAVNAPGIPGQMTPDMLEADRIRAERWLKEAGHGNAQAAKANISRQLSERLADDESAWEAFRDYKANGAPVFSNGYKVISNEQTIKIWDELSLAKHAGKELDASLLIAVGGKYGLSLSDLIPIAKQVKLDLPPKLAAKGAKVGHQSGLKSFADTTKAERAQLLNSECSNRVSTWAANSGDSHTESVMMQMAVKDEFGVTGDPFVAFRAGHSRSAVEQQYAKSQGFYRKFARAMYDNTQAEFKAAGITHVSAYRGMSFGNPPPEWAKFGVNRVELQPMNAWSTDHYTATRFADGLAGNGGGPHKIIIEGSIPVEMIVGSARSGFGCLGEMELVIMDGAGFTRVKKR